MKCTCLLAPCSSSVNFQLKLMRTQGKDGAWSYFNNLILASLCCYLLEMGKKRNSFFHGSLISTVGLKLEAKGL